MRSTSSKAANTLVGLKVQFDGGNNLSAEVTLPFASTTESGRKRPMNPSSARGRCQRRCQPRTCRVRLSPFTRHTGRRMSGPIDRCLESLDVFLTEPANGESVGIEASALDLVEVKVHFQNLSWRCCCNASAGRMDAAARYRMVSGDVADTCSRRRQGSQNVGSWVFDEELDVSRMNLVMRHSARTSPALQLQNVGESLNSHRQHETMSAEENHPAHR